MVKCVRQGRWGQRKGSTFSWLSLEREILAQPTQLLTSCASLAKLTNFSKLQITHMQKGYKNIFDMWFFQKTLSTGPGT